MAAAGGGQGDQIVVVEAVVLQAAVSVHHRVAQHGAQFRLRLLAVRAQPVEQCDVVALHAGPFQLSQQRWQDAVVGRRARDVGMHDHHRVAWPDQISQRRRRDGRAQRGQQRRLLVRQTGHEARGNDVCPVGQIDVETAAAIGQLHTHHSNLR